MKSRYRLPLWILLALVAFLIVLHTVSHERTGTR